MENIYIFGHKKPDTDTVTAAISLSYLKNEIGMNTKPMVLGEINKETEFVLNYFNVEKPELLEDVKLQIKDLNYYKNCYVNEFDSISKTYKYMCDKNITGVPVVDNDNKFKGLLTSKMIGKELINGNFIKLNTSYKNIMEVLDGEELVKIDDEIKGNIIVASFRSTTFLNTLELEKNTIMIVGDRHSLIEAAIENKIKLIIIVGNLEIKEEHISLAKKNNVNIIRTGYDTFHVTKLITLSNYVNNLLSDTRSISFNANDYYDEFKEKCVKLGYNNYPVIDDYGKCLGLIRITDINKKNKKQVILVDHNEASQSVEGLNEAEILEIIDHHNIGSITTSMPINFRNMIVASTNTIIYSMYNENNIEIPSDMAGLMLSGIISDTLKFTSPTTTEYDKMVARILAKKAGVNLDKYSDEMLKAGASLEGKTTLDVIDGDIKSFEVNDKKISISQVTTFNADEILNKKEEYIEKIDEIVKNREYNLMIFSVTDIIKGGSYIFYNSSSEELVRLIFNNSNMNQGHFVKGCFSRKKQLVPLVMNVIR